MSIRPCFRAHRAGAPSLVELHGISTAIVVSPEAPHAPPDQGQPNPAQKPTPSFDKLLLADAKDLPDWAKAPGLQDAQDGRDCVRWIYKFETNAMSFLVNRDGRVQVVAITGVRTPRIDPLQNPVPGIALSQSKAGLLELYGPANPPATGEHVAAESPADELALERLVYPVQGERDSTLTFTLRSDRIVQIKLAIKTG